MKHYGDVSKINGAEVEPVDIITFGAPCQDLSVAGKRMGLKHSAMGDEETTRSGLFFEAIRIIKEMREATNNEYPKYAVYENVPGAFSSNKGNDFHAVLEALCSVCDDTVSIPKPYDKKRTDKLVWNKAGEIVGNNYSIAWRTLDAQYWGVPQRRKRIYLVADFTGRCAGEILFKPDSLRGDMSQGNEAGQEVAADAVGGVDGSVGVNGNNCLTPYDVQSRRCFSADGAWPALYGGEGGGHGYVLAPKGSVDGSVGVECLNPWDCQSKRIYNPDGIYCTLPAMDCGGANNQAVIYSFDSLSSNSIDRAAGFCQGASPAARTIGYQEELSPTAKGASSGTAQVPAVVQPVIVLNDQGGSSINVESEPLSPTLRANSHQHEPVIALQANGIDRADTAGCNGAGWRENESYTLNTVDRHAVCYDARNHNAQDISGTIQAKSNGGQSLNFINPVCYDARGNGDGKTVLFEPRSPDGEPRIYDDICPTLNTAQGGQRQPCIVENSNPPRKYIIRRLTPTECARLQGFPDWWSTLAPYDPADAEFWEDVRKTHAEINGKKYKPVKDIKKWYEKLHTDSAEYRMWGNGLALPNAEYVLQGIAEHGAKTLGSLFDGSGGFPLAGVLNGIKPIWASEVEPYPIAVTKSRF